MLALAVVQTKPNPFEESLSASICVESVLSHLGCLPCLLNSLRVGGSFGLVGESTRNEKGEMLGGGCLADF